MSLKTSSFSLRFKKKNKKKRLSSIFKKNDLEIQNIFNKKIDGVEFKNDKKDNEIPYIERATFKRICEWIIWKGE